jgi:hypothetical protein
MLILMEISDSYWRAILILIWDLHLHSLPTKLNNLKYSDYSDNLWNFLSFILFLKLQFGLSIRKTRKHYLATNADADANADSALGNWAPTPAGMGRAVDHLQ